MGLRRLATTAIGTERGVFDSDAAAAVLASTIAARAEQGLELPERLVVAVGGPNEAGAYRLALQALGAAR